MDRASHREGSNSNTSNISRVRPRRKRRRRRRRVKKSPEEVQTATDELKFQVRPKRGRRRRKRKRKVHIKENGMCLESSGASTPPLSSNSFGSQPSFSQSCNDFSQGSPMEYENLPWANLKVPMDLSLVDLEINGDGVDFDLQAQKNHLRWLANVEKARENDVCLHNTSE